MDPTSFSFNRRAVLAGVAGAGLLAAAAAGAAVAETAAPAGRRAFPKGFRWGCATAGHQIEGNNTNADLWVLENIKPSIYVERSGDACDSYHRYAEDIALLAGFGFDTYRLSIEWARIEPSPGAFSTAELDYYRRVLETCHRHGVAPAVTFLHGAAPRWFAEAGGWLNPDAPKLFARYCQTAARALGGEMAYAFTINEPQVPYSFRVIPAAKASFVQRDAAARAMLDEAARVTGAKRFVTMDDPDIDGMTPQLIAGHEQGFAAIKAERPKLPVGVTLNITDFQPATDDQAYAEIRAKAYGPWLETCKRTGDFTGVQVYRQIPIAGQGKPLPRPAPLPFVDPRAGFLAQTARPEALRNGVEYVHAQTGKPVFVTENGFESPNDAARIQYIDAALGGLHEAVAKGVPVIGYLHWSLLDNFEWTQGYRPKYGLVAVDRTTFQRTPKPSATHLGAIARRNAI